MNDPAHTDHDGGLLNDLEAEYLELAAAGDFKAIDYALAECDDVSHWAQTTIMRILVLAAPGETNDALAAWATVARQQLLGVLVQHVAPLWAASECSKRVVATQEMVAEWRDELELA